MLCYVMLYSPQYNTFKYEARLKNKKRPRGWFFVNMARWLFTSAPCVSVLVFSFIFVLHHRLIVLCSPLFCMPCHRSSLVGDFVGTGHTVEHTSSIGGPLKGAPNPPGMWRWVPLFFTASGQPRSAHSWGSWWFRPQPRSKWCSQGLTSCVAMALLDSSSTHLFCLMGSGIKTFCLVHKKGYWRYVRKWRGFGGVMGTTHRLIHCLFYSFLLHFDFV